jgi:hypothetical protein
MNKYLLIENKGVLQVEALTLLGASTKREDHSKIGMFGSGNKYALAYLLRNGIGIRILTGGAEIKLSTEKAMLRDKEFEVMTINDVRTSITTDFGLQWDLWGAIRELYCNAMDEGLMTFKIVTEDELPDKLFCGNENTQIILKADDAIEDIMFNINDYLSYKKEVIFSCAEGQILRKHGMEGRVYHKGVLCQVNKKGSIFDYNLFNIDVNESRQIRYAWQVSNEMWKIIFKCDNPTIVRQVLDNVTKEGLLEGNINEWGYDDQSDKMAAEVWNDVIEDKFLAPENMGGYVNEEERIKTLFLPQRLYNAITSRCSKAKPASCFSIVSESGFCVEAIPSATQMQVYDQAMTFLKECKYQIYNKVRFVEFEKKDVLASIENKDILISLTVLNQGVHQVVCALIEEYLHIKSGKSDMTRAFQNALFDEFVTYMKTINAYSI